MRKTFATIALAAIALTGCNLETPPGIPDVEIGDAATIDRDSGITGHDPLPDGWSVRSQTVDYGTHTVTRYPDGVTVSATTLER